MSQTLPGQSLKALEFDKILELLAKECSCADSEAAAHALTPFGGIEEARGALQETQDACRLCLRFGGPSFSGLRNIDADLRRAKLGSSLAPGELLLVAGVLSAIRGLARYREMTQSEETCLNGSFDSLAPNKFLEEQIT